MISTIYNDDDDRQGLFVWNGTSTCWKHTGWLGAAHDRCGFKAASCMVLAELGGLIKAWPPLAQARGCPCVWYAGAAPKIDSRPRCQVTTCMMCYAATKARMHP